MRDLRVMAMATPAPMAISHAKVPTTTSPKAFHDWNPEIRAANDLGANVITIYDVIGDDFWSGGGVTVNRIDAALRKIGNQAVEVHVNSPGGDMFEGIAIYNRLLEHPAPVTVKVMGLAASAASIIAMAGSEILIGPASFIMIHDCAVIAQGNRHDMADTAAWLEPFDAAMADVYAARTGIDAAEVSKMLDAETWMNGTQAIEKGFADALLKPDEMQIDETGNEQAGSANAMRRAERALLAAGASPAEARATLDKIKGPPAAAIEPPASDAGDTSWHGDLAALTTLLRS